jgi:hypothetical protein
MAGGVYVLCALTSLACAVLLLRGYVVLPERDLTIFRSLPVLAGLAVLLYGLVWDAR